MVSDREILESLVRVASNQQKILNKLAQHAGVTTGWANIENFVTDRLKNMPEAAGLSLAEAKVGRDSGAVRISFRGQARDFAAVARRLQDSLLGHLISTDDGGDAVAVTKDPANINVFPNV